MRLLQRPWRRLIDEPQLADRRPPRGKLESDARQVDLGDLGLEMGSTSGVLEFAPQPVGDARFGPPGSSGTLVGRRSAGADGREASHPAAEVVPWHPSQAGVDDDAHAADRQR